MNDIFAKSLKLPPSVRGLVVPAPDGDYQILLNSAYTPEQQLETYHHEMRHILLGHYGQSGRPLQTLEAEADDKALIPGKIKYAARHGLPPARLFPAGGTDASPARPSHTAVNAAISHFVESTPAPSTRPMAAGAYTANTCARPVKTASRNPLNLSPAALALHRIHCAHLTGMLTASAFPG